VEVYKCGEFYSLSHDDLVYNVSRYVRVINSLGHAHLGYNESRYVWVMKSLWSR